MDGGRLGRAILRLRSQGHATGGSVTSEPRRWGGCDWKKIRCHRGSTDHANRPREGRDGTHKIATGEIKDVRPTPESEGKNAAAVALGRMGGKARAAGMSAKRRREIARKAAKTRWSE